MFATILVPDFPLQAALRSSPALRAKPVALLDGKKAIVVGATAAALRLGIFCGLTPTQAQARCANVIFQNRDPDQERIVYAAMLELARSVSPNVEATREGICTIDLRRLRAGRNFTALGLMLRDQLAALGLSAQIGIAANPDTAALAARMATPVALLDGDYSSLNELPISTLQPEEETARVLHLWGIRSVADFISLRREEVHARLGQHAARLWNVATGRSERLLRLNVPGEEFSEEFDFEFEVETSEQLLFILRRFVDALSARLSAACLVGKELQWTLRFSDGSESRRDFSIPSPTANAGVWFRIIATYLENYAAESSIVSARLTVIPTKSSKDQFELFSGALRDPNQFAETVAKLGAMLGNDRVGVPLLRDTHRPDAATTAAVDCSTLTLPQENKATCERLGLALSRFRPPIPATVLLLENKPVFVHTKPIAGKVTDARGPWLLSGDWWQGAWRREEWDIELNTGGLYRIFREGKCWFVEGLYD